MSIKEILEKANQIHLQMVMLDELGKHSMSAKQLRELCESIGGDYESILPILKRANLIKAEPKHGYMIVYSLNRNLSLPLPNRKSQSSIIFSVSYGNPSRKPVLYCRVEIPCWETVK